MKKKPSEKLKLIIEWVLKMIYINLLYSTLGMITNEYWWKGSTS